MNGPDGAEIAGQGAAAARSAVPTGPATWPIPMHWALEPAGYEIEIPVDAAVFTMGLTVGEGDLAEIIPHVPNTTYVHWVEALAAAHSASVGLDDAAYLQTRRLFVVREHRIDYLAESRAGDRLQMATWVAWFEKSRSERHALIVREQDDRVIMRARTIWVYIDMDRRRAVRVPEDVIARFQR
jgi:acyl-CoA thioester hydrolase